MAPPKFNRNAAALQAELAATFNGPMHAVKQASRAIRERGRDRDRDRDPGVTAREVAAKMAQLIQAEFTFIEQQSDSEGSAREEQSCIIVVGSTGTGKSSTISRCTGRDVPSGNGKDRVTVQCNTYKRKSSGGGSAMDPVWIDTVGWDDADLRDDHSFRDILRFIDDRQLLRVKCIVWCILPNVRRDGLLTKQARMINLFKDKDIWHNVVIVCKQSRNPADDAQGALGAARDYNPRAKIPVLGYTYMDDPTLTDRQRTRLQDPGSREDFLIKTDAEVSDAILTTLCMLGPPIQVVFQNQACLDCGQTGDSRLMTNFCHMDRVQVHPGHLVQYHPGQLEKFHESNKAVREHKEGLYQPWYSMDCCMLKCGGERYICCGALSEQPGCRKIRSCCGKPYIEGDDPIAGCVERYRCCKVHFASRVQGCKSKYECCERKARSKGCRDVCKKCDRPWGSAPGDCFEKEHNIIVHIEDQKKPEGLGVGDVKQNGTFRKIKSALPEF